MKHSSRKTEGFSLTEIVIALGIAAYSLVGILGLLSVAHRGTSASVEETAMVLIINDLLADAHQNRPYNLPSYYDVNGTKITPNLSENDPPSAPSEALYQCTRTVDTPASSPQLRKLTFTIQWPAGNPTQSKVIHLNLASF